MEEAIDVIFLDIKMPGLSGTDFLRSLNSRQPMVVFTTAYRQHAVEGFELNAVDYLLKTITFERLCSAVRKVRKKLASRIHSSSTNHIFIKQNTKLIKVNFEDILFVQAARDFCTLHLSAKKRLLAGGHLKDFSDKLPDDSFIRCHRSYLVNLGKITGILGNTIDIEGVEIPIGHSYKEQLFKRLGL